jgi:hypothetical protein
MKVRRILVPAAVVGMIVGTAAPAPAETYTYYLKTAFCNVSATGVDLHLTQTVNFRVSSRGRVHVRDVSASSANLFQMGKAAFFIDIKGQPNSKIAQWNPNPSGGVTTFHWNGVDTQNGETASGMSVYTRVWSEDDTSVTCAVYNSSYEG